MRIQLAATLVALQWMAPVAITGVLANEAQSEEKWSTFTSKAGRFSIEMPNRPKKTETHRRSFVGKVTNHIFTATGDDDLFTVDYSDIPRFALRFAGRDTVYEHAKGALLMQTFGKPTSYRDLSVAGAMGKRLVYDTPPVEGHPKMRGDAILVLIGARLYVIDAVVPEADADVKSHRFLSSLEITH